MKYNRYLWQVILVLILAAILISCSTNHLHRSGNYRVRSIDSLNLYSFYWVKGIYQLPDTNAKIGQKIYLKRVYDSTKANVVRIK